MATPPIYTETGIATYNYLRRLESRLDRLEGSNVGSLVQSLIRSGTDTGPVGTANVYLRLDAVNDPVTGVLQLDQTLRVLGATTLSAALQVGGLHTASDTIKVNPPITGASCVIMRAGSPSVGMTTLSPDNTLSTSMTGHELWIKGDALTASDGSEIVRWDSEGTPFFSDGFTLDSTGPQMTASDPNINSHPAAWIGGTHAGYLDSATSHVFGGAGTGLTWLLVYRVSDITGATGERAVVGAANLDGNRSGLRPPGSSASAFMSVHDKGGSGTRVTVSDVPVSAVPSDESWHIAVFRKNVSDEWFCYFDAVDQSNAITDTANFDLKALFRDRDLTPFTGLGIAEFIGYDADIGDANTRQVHDYLAEKYGLPGFTSAVVATWGLNQVDYWQAINESDVIISRLQRDGTGVKMAINTTTPACTLDVDGSICASGQVQAGSLLVSGLTTLSDTAVDDLTAVNLQVTGLTTLSCTDIYKLNVQTTLTAGNLVATSLDLEDLQVTGLTTLSCTDVHKLNVQTTLTIGGTIVDSGGTLDATYLRLDTTNDPLTNDLDIAAGLNVQTLATISTTLDVGTTASAGLLIASRSSAVDNSRIIVRDEVGTSNINAGYVVRASDDSDKAFYGFDSSNNLRVENKFGNNLSLFTNALERLRIDGSGLIFPFGNTRWNDNVKTLWGSGDDSSVYYDGTDLNVDPAEVGSGAVKVLGLVDMDSGNQVQLSTISNSSVTTPSTDHVKLFFSDDDDTVSAMKDDGSVVSLEGGGGISTASGDLRYLKLDTSNDPLTGDLDIDAALDVSGLTTLSGTYIGATCTVTGTLTEGGIVMLDRARMQYGNVANYQTYYHPITNELITEQGPSGFGVGEYVFRGNNVKLQLDDDSATGTSIQSTVEFRDSLGTMVGEVGMKGSQLELNNQLGATAGFFIGSVAKFRVETSFIRFFGISATFQDNKRIYLGDIFSQDASIHYNGGTDELRITPRQSATGTCRILGHVDIDNDLNLDGDLQVDLLSTLSGAVVCQSDHTVEGQTIQTAGLVATRQTVSIDTTLTEAAQYTLANSTSDTIVWLPATPTDGNIQTIKNINTGAVTINGNGGNIDGTSLVTISTQYDALKFISDGTDWFIV